MSIAFLFPGRGSQRPGMLHRLPDTTASATVLAEADGALRSLVARSGAGAGYGGEYADSIAELDTAEALEQSPVACHVALLVAGVAGARALVEDEGVRPSLVAGHDAGGYAAAVLAEVLTFEEALRAVRLRGQLLERAEEPEGDIAIRLAQHLATIERRAQAVPYLSGVYGRVLRGETNAVFDDLARSVARPVRWAEMTAALGQEGARCCVELPPGRALTGRLTAELPGVQAVSVEEVGIAEAADRAHGASPGGAGRGEFGPAPSEPGGGWGVPEWGGSGWGGDQRGLA